MAYKVKEGDIVIIDSSASMRTKLEDETRFERAIGNAVTFTEEVLNKNGIVSVIMAEEKALFLAERAKIQLPVVENSEFNKTQYLKDRMYKEKADEIFKCIPMKMEKFYDRFDKECMDIPIFKYLDPYQLFQRISCASNEDIVLIKEKLLNRAEKYTKEIEPEMKNVKLLKQIIDDYLKGKEQTIKIVMLKEFSNALGTILDKYKMSFWDKKEDKIEE